MTKKYFFALGVAASLSLNTMLDASNPNQTLPIAKRFSIKQGLKEGVDYQSKTIILKVKPQYRNICTDGYINNADVNMIFNWIGAQKFNKRFPNQKAPERERNSAGVKMADLSLVFTVKYSSNIGLEKAINKLLETGIFDFAEPDYMYSPLVFNPNDPRAAVGQQQYNYLNRIKAFDAWDITTNTSNPGSQGSVNTVIGIVDSGSDLDHPDLAGNLYINSGDPVNGLDDDNDGYFDNNAGWDLAGADYNNVVGDNNANTTGANNSHGSHVSGCAAASTNNGVGVAGVGFNCKFLPVKCAADNDTRGSGGVGYIIAGYDGITYAADHGAQIINCSWGGAGGGSFGQLIIDYATINKNCLVVAAAGNDASEGAFYPAAYTYVLSVAATNATNDSKASFSNWDYSVDISAPGNGIYNTIYNDSYTSQSGTSMASPIVAGGAGLVLSKWPTYTGMQCGERLKVTADNHYTGSNLTSYNNKLGTGRMNLYKALTDPDKPSVVPSNAAYNDNNDQAFVAGDTINFIADWTDYLAPTTNATVAVTAVGTTAANVTIVQGAATLGAINTLQTVNNNTQPFRFKINAGTPLNTVITLQAVVTDGSYTAKYFFTVTVNVDYVNININEVGTTISSKGKIGFNADGAVEGLGFTYAGEQLLYEAALMIGTSTTAVSDAFRGATGNTADADFVSMENANRLAVPIVSEFDVTGKANDNAATPVQNVQTRYNAYAWSTPGHTKYVIVEYIIKNTGAPLANLYAGIAGDWDIPNYANNKTDYDATKNMGYAYSTDALGKWAGVKLLTNSAGPNFYGIDNVAGGGGGVDLNDAGNYVSTSDKYTVLSTTRNQAGGTGTGTDIMMVMSSGPYSINTNDSITVAFALIAGDDLADLQASADSADVQYNGPTSVGIKNNVSNELYANIFPNPNNGSATLMFTADKASTVNLTILNSLGQVVKQVNNFNATIGVNTQKVDLSDLPNGTYFYKLRINDKESVRKLVISK